MPSNQDAAATSQKRISLTTAKSVRSFVLPLAQIGRNNHILLAFSAVCKNIILKENSDVFRKSQGPGELYFLIQQSRISYKCENSQKVRHGLSCVKIISML